MTFFRRKKSLNITDGDATYKVVYLGNVLTLVAKGDSCCEKPMQILWRNYTVNQRKDIKMKLTVCNSGLKAETSEHGLTEYWAHRITFCGTHPDFPKLFGWIYRHEGKKMKPELRFHAALCSKTEKAQQMASLLSQKLVWALNEFKREKISRQNARRLHEILTDITPVVCKRKQILSTGGKNFRPEVERSKSAPRLGAIEEEDVMEEDEEDEEIMSSTLKRQSSAGASSVVTKLTAGSSDYDEEESLGSWSINSSPAGSWNVKRRTASTENKNIPFIEKPSSPNNSVFVVADLKKAIEETSSLESGYGDELRT